MKYKYFQNLKYNIKRGKKGVYYLFNFGSIFLLYIFSPNDSPSKTMKNTFYFN